MAILGILIALFGIVGILWSQDRRNLRFYSWLRQRWVNQTIVVVSTIVVAIGVSISVAPVGWTVALIVAAVCSAALGFCLHRVGAKRKLVIGVIIVVAMLAFLKYGSPIPASISVSPPSRVTVSEQDGKITMKVILSEQGTRVSEFQDVNLTHRGWRFDFYPTIQGVEVAWPEQGFGRGPLSRKLDFRPGTMVPVFYGREGTEVWIVFTPPGSPTSPSPAPAPTPAPSPPIITL